MAKLAKKLLASFPECTRYTKQQVNFWKDLAWHQTVRHAQDWLALHYTSWEPVEGMRAFVEKRPSRYRLLRERAAEGRSSETPVGAADPRLRRLRREQSARRARLLRRLRRRARRRKAAA